MAAPADDDRLYDAAAVRALDEAAIAAGIPAETLMQRAAEAAWTIAGQRWPGARQVAVVCGPGNNGGDGYALARLAKASGRRVRLCAVGPAPQSPAARVHRAAWLAAGGAIETDPSAALDGAELVVDALLGLGLSRAPDAAFADAIAAINGAGAPVLALDLPSGLDADTGAAPGAAVRAALTVSFIAQKFGLWTGAGPSLAGERVLATLGIPPSLPRLAPKARRLGPEGLRAALPPRDRAAHKGHHGHVLVVGGAPGMAGAAVLAARAALRGGAGWVSLATHPAHAAAVAAAQPELMVHPLDAAGALKPLLARASVVVMGPGLGTAAWGQALFDAVMAAARPLVVDADGLNLLAQRSQHLGGAVITPHPGEAARLLGAPDAAVIQRDRASAACALHQRFGAVAVLKGAGTLVADAEGLAVCPAGNPGMAVAGMGDVLAGLIGALMAQGLTPGTAARVGVYAHAAAADAVAARRGERGLLPLDVVEALAGPLNPERGWS